MSNSVERFKEQPPNSKTTSLNQLNSKGGSNNGGKKVLKSTRKLASSKTSLKVARDEPLVESVVRNEMQM